MPSVNFDNHFKDLFDHTNDLIQFVSVDGTIQLVNAAWLSTLQYTLDEVEGESIYKFIHPHYVDDYKSIREDAIHSANNCEIESILLSKKGEEIFVEGQVGCSFYKNIPVYTRAVLKNVTTKRKSEKIVEESEKRINTLFKKGPDAIIIIDENQKILEWNPKATEIFGFEEKEAQGKFISDLIIPQQFREAHKKGMAHFLKTGEGPVLNKTIEITALHKTGKEFYVNLSISNVQVGDGWLFIAFLSDISVRKATEESLIKKEAELMQTKMLEEKRDEFISIASHELKTPLTTIKAYTQLAVIHSELQKPEKVYEFLIKAENHIEKLNNLISTLLDVSKIHSGQLLLNKETFQFDIFLSSFIENIQTTLPNQQVLILKNDVAWINGDMLRLEQVITNLLTNAAKYAPSKKEIVMKSIVSDSSLIFSVKDQGMGIPADHHHKIFTRFYRVEETGTQFNGLGIGLFISAEIINQHGGKIWVESKQGEGSTFFVQLPLASK